MGRLIAAVTLLATAGLAAPAAAQAPRLQPFIVLARVIGADFLPFGEYAPLFAALDKGWYREEGLAVTIERVLGSGETLGRLAAGRGDAALADFSALAAARANEGLPLTAVLAYYRRPPHALFVRAGAGIDAPKDLAGKTVAITPGNSHRLFFPLLAEAAGFRADAVTWVTMDPAAMAPALLAGRVDAIPLFAHHEARLARLARRRGTAIRRLAYADHGVDAYSLVLVAREADIARDAERLRAFARATIRGMRYAFEPGHHREAARLALAGQRGRDLEAVTGAVAAASRHAVTEEVATGRVAIGQFEPARVERSRDLYARALGLTRAVPVETLYTNALLPETR